MLLQYVYQLFGMVLFEVVVIFWIYFFFVLKLGIKTNVPILKSVAGIKRELIWLFIFCLYNNFFDTFW